jgi:hypothetical protein
MMGSAEHDQVVQVGRAAVQPMDEMMTFAPGQRPITVREDAAAVADRQGVALRRGDDPTRPPDLQWLAGSPTKDRGEQGQGGLEPLGQPLALALAARVEGRWSALALTVMLAARGLLAVGMLAADQYPGQGGVTGQPPARLGLQRPGPARLPTQGAVTAKQAFQVDGDQQLGPHTTGPGQLAGFQGTAGQLGQGISGPLAAAAGILALAGRANGSRAASRVWPASGSKRPLTATI